MVMFGIWWSPSWQHAGPSADNIIENLNSAEKVNTGGNSIEIENCPVKSSYAIPCPAFQSLKIISLFSTPKQKASGPMIYWTASLPIAPAERIVLAAYLPSGYKVVVISGRRGLFDIIVKATVIRSAQFPSDFSCTTDRRITPSCSVVRRENSFSLSLKHQIPNFVLIRTNRMTGPRKTLYILQKLIVEEQNFNC